MLEAIGKIITDAIRQIFFMLDNIVYSLIPKLYQLLVYLANVNLYKDNDTIKALMNRVYILIGIFMLFRLAFSVMRYIIDPGSFSDQSKGFTSLVRRVLIAIILLVAMPWIFDEVYDIQAKILTSNIIPKLILGSADTMDTSNLESAAKDVQFLVFGPFYSVNYDIPDSSGNTENGPLKDCKPQGNYAMANILGTSHMALAADGNGSCLQAFADEMNKNNDVKASGAQVTDFFKTTSSGANDTRNFAALGGLVTWTINNQYAIDYLPVISTLCGGYLVFLLLSFCIDVATRAIKLLFLQILSPVAIITSIDPTESSQNSKLKEWGSECLKTFAALFLRLVVFFVVIQMIKVITGVIFAGGTDMYMDPNLDKNNDFMNIFVYIFLVMGSFQVAKSVPQLVEKAFGIKMSGEINLNPFKNPFVTGAIGLGVGAAGGLAANALAAPGRIKKLQQDWREGGGIEGAKQRALNKVKNFDNSLTEFGKQFGRYDNPSQITHDNINRLRDARRANRADYRAGRITEQQYRDRDATIKEGIVEGKVMRAQQKAKETEAHDEAWGKVKSSASEAVREGTNIVRHFTEPVSTVAGVAAGGVSAGARGATSGYKTSDPKAALEAGNRARRASNDAREERNSRIDMSREGKYSMTDRLHDTIDKFSGVKGKTYGVGKASDDIKMLNNALRNVQAQLRTANENAANTRMAPIHISNDGLRVALNEGLNRIASVTNTKDLNTVQTEIINNIQANSYGAPASEITDAVRHVSNFSGAMGAVVDYTERTVELQKEIKQREDITNIGGPGGLGGGPGGGPGGPGKP